MQQTIKFGRVQPSVLSIFECIVKNCKVWLNAKSKTFSALCGEDFSHKEVLLAHAVVIVLLFVAGIAGALEGGVV